MRYFEPVKDAVKYFIPIRKTKFSAGYDFITPEPIMIFPNQIKIIQTNIKVSMPEDEYLQLSIRSSLGVKGLMMPNSPGIVDSDYYGNVQNDGNIGIILTNISLSVIRVNEGERVMQGIFLKYQVTNDEAIGERKGGLGSTGRSK